MKRLVISAIVLTALIVPTAVAQDSFEQTTIDESFLNQIYNSFISSSNPKEGSVDTLNVLYNCFIKGNYEQVGSCYESKASQLSATPYEVWYGESRSDDNGDDKANPGELTIRETSAFTDSTPLYTANTLSVKATDLRDLSNQEKKFYDDSKITFTVSTPHSGDQNSVSCEGTPDPNTCTASKEVTPQFSGEYTVKAEAQTSDGRTVSLQRSFQAVAEGLPPENKPELGGEFSDWEPHWETASQLENYLEFTTPRDNSFVLIDSGDTGFCGDAVIRKTVTVQPGRAKTVSVDYQLNTGINPGEVGIWWGSQEEIVDYDDDVSETGTWRLEISQPSWTDTPARNKLNIGLRESEETCTSALRLQSPTRLVIDDVDIS
ncbi:hypothetical protein [Candidatus Nanohalococcus occultus]|uniref:hypothetical protein n=1 Tax=Candidatus Nanohalococcus occultus TaxID=2978047 RepID=UPI0039DF6A49